MYEHLSWHETGSIRRWSATFFSWITLYKLSELINMIRAKFYWT